MTDAETGNGPFQRGCWTDEGTEMSYDPRAYPKYETGGGRSGPQSGKYGRVYSEQLIGIRIHKGRDGCEIWEEWRLKTDMGPAVETRTIPVEGNEYAAMQLLIKRCRETA